MDSMAKNQMMIAKRSLRHYMIVAEPWSIWLHGRKIAADLSETIYDAVRTPETLEYWEKR
jgi:hypothetical protein